MKMAKGPYDGPVPKHQHLATGGDPYAEYPHLDSGGSLRNPDDTSWDGSGNIHTTDPSKAAGHSHGSHGHSSVESHYESQKGGHKDMHSLWPDGNDGGHKKGGNY